MKLKEEMPTPIFVDLKPNRLLLDSKFDGYKLSLDSLPSYLVPLNKGVDRVGPADDQYSIQHAKLFARHNCLISDPWNPSLFYIVDGEWNVCRFRFDPETTKFDEVQEVWYIPTKPLQIVGRYNVTVMFPSDKSALLSDGCGTLFLLETGNREHSENWQVSNRFDFKEAVLNNLDQFSILDCISYQQDNENCIDVLLMRICERNDKKWSDFFDSHESQFFKTPVNHPFVTTVDWLTLAQGNTDTWHLKSTRTLIGPSGIDYASIEAGGNGIHVASENHFAFVHVSDQLLKYSTTTRKSKLEDSDNKPDYLWMQNSEEIFVWFRIPIEANKKDVNIDIKTSSISVSYNGTLMLEGEFSRSIKADESVWTLTAASSLLLSVSDSSNETDQRKIFQCLEIILQKSEQDVTWEGDSFIRGNSTGQQIIDPELAKQIHERLGHLCSDKWDAETMKANVFDSQQLEECDNFPADTTSIMRIDPHLQCITHSASLGSHQWLFSVRVEANKVPAICIRHDVDGLVWQPAENSITLGRDDIGQWELNHIGTFSALGYVQASKQQRKFTVCSPDFSYVAICDSFKHIYIYRQPSTIDTDLRNRRTGEIVSHIAKQQIVSIDPPLETFGAFATKSHLFVLTTKNMHAVRINQVSDL